MISVIRLQVTPVKGTALHGRSGIELGPGGVADNRRFYIVDERGSLFNGKKEGRLVQIRADFEPRAGRLALHFPDGAAVAERWVSGDPVSTDFYGRPVTGNRVVGPWSQALSDFCDRPLCLIAASDPGGGVDVHAVTIVSRGSLERLRSAGSGAERLDYRRFRMLVEVDGVDAHGEDRWCGRLLNVGTATVEIIGPVPRCVVTAQNPDSGVSDFNTLQTILAYRGALHADLSTPSAHLPDGGKIVFGVYGRVIRPGRVDVGDSVSEVEVATSGAAANV